MADYLFPCLAVFEALDNHIQRLEQYLRKIAFTFHLDWEGKLFAWGSELGVHINTISTRVNAIPAPFSKVDGIQYVQTKRRPFSINRQPLIAKTALAKAWTTIATQIRLQRK